MFDKQSLNVVLINRAEPQVIQQIARDVDIHHPLYVDYVLGKLIVTRGFCERYPTYPIEMIEPHDRHSIVIVSKGTDVLPVGVIRICFDQAQELPVTPYVRNEYIKRKARGEHLAEVGRLFVQDGNDRTYKHFMALVYLVALELNIDCYLIQVRSEHVAMYESLFGAKVVPETQSCDGCQHLAWEVRKTPPQFMRRFPVDACKWVKEAS